MKQSLIKNFIGLSLLFVCSTLFGANPPPQQGKAPPPPSDKKPLVFHPPTLPSLNPSTIFSSPGIATLEGSEWVGSDHLYNLPTSLGIVVEIVKPGAGVHVTQSPGVDKTASVPPSPSGQNIPLFEDKIKELVATGLKTIHVMPREPIIERGTPLPFIHFLIIVHPIEKGFVVYCSGRLFEAVQLSRIFLKTGITFQAITWEKQELIITPPDQLRQQVEETVQNIVNAYTDRIKNYALEKAAGQRQ